jgi:hypothetical protein
MDMVSRRTALVAGFTSLLLPAVGCQFRSGATTDKAEQLQEFDELIESLDSIDYFSSDRQWVSTPNSTVQINRIWFGAADLENPVVKNQLVDYQMERVNESFKSGDPEQNTYKLTYQPLYSEPIVLVEGESARLRYESMYTKASELLSTLMKEVTPEEQVLQKLKEHSGFIVSLAGDYKFQFIVAKDIPFQATPDERESLPYRYRFDLFIGERRVLSLPEGSPWAKQAFSQAARQGWFRDLPVTEMIGNPLHR